MPRRARAAVLLLAAACAGHQADSPLPESGAGTELALRPLGGWIASSFVERDRRLIRSASALAVAWDSLGPGDRPVIDFTRETVILAAAGERTSGGHSIAVTAARDSAGLLLVTVVERAPGADCMTTSMITHPAVAVAVPVVARPARFIERRETAPCN